MHRARCLEELKIARLRCEEHETDEVDADTDSCGSKRRRLGAQTDALGVNFAPRRAEVSDVGAAP